MCIQVEHGISAAFELEYILIEGTDIIIQLSDLIVCVCLGHCSDGVTGQPTQGLQFVLGTQEQQDIFDTIVMANLVSV